MSSYRPVRLPRSAAVLVVLAALGVLPALRAVDTPAVPDPDPARWDAEIGAFARADAVPDRPIVFVGSSSFRLWKTLAADFPGLPVVNRGFGGSHLSDLNVWFERLVVPLRPSVVLVYEGDNDLASGKSPEQFLSDVRTFRDLMARHLPGVPVGFLAIKPSPSRERLLAVQAEANRQLRRICDEEETFHYLDIATPLLDASGRPDPLYFGRDRLHMNANGYRRWTEVIGGWLRTLPAAASGRVTSAGSGSRP